MSQRTHLPPSPNNCKLLGPIMVLGFALAVVMWIAALGLHFPGVDVPASIAGPGILAAWLGGAALLGLLTPAHNKPARLIIGVGSGAFSALLGVLILGSMLVEPAQGELPASGLSGLRPGAILAASGFLVLGAVIGGTGAAIACGIPPRSPSGDISSNRWLARMGIVTVLAAAPLLLLGGAVTSTNSGMAIIGWPDSYGANMFLYPISLMVSDHQRFLEHTHRLFGSLVGLSTLSLMIYTLCVDRRSWARKTAVFLFLLVVAQGVLGGVRVRLGSVDAAADNRYWSLIHGVTAQLFVALLAAFAVMLAPTFRLLAARRGRCLKCGYDLSGTPRTASCTECGAAWPWRELGALTAGLPPADHWRRLKGMSTGLLHASILQLLLGAAYRHLKAGSPPPPHAGYAVWTHAAFSIVVVFTALATAFALQAASRDAGPLTATLRRLGKAMVGVVAMQFVLGWAALWAVSADPNPDFPWLQPLIATLHQANGAVHLSLAAVAYTWIQAIRPIEHSASETHQAPAAA